MNKRLLLLRSLFHKIRIAFIGSGRIVDNLKITLIQVQQAVTLAISAPNEELPKHVEKVLMEIAAIYKYITDDFIEFLQGNHLHTVACFHADYIISTLEEQVKSQEQEIMQRDALLCEYIDRYSLLSEGENL